MAQNIYAVGQNNSGQLGLNDLTNRSSPVLITTLPRTVLMTAAGENSTGDHSLFLLDDGTIRAVGNNSNGSLGNGYTSSMSSPVSVVGGRSYSFIMAGYGSSFAIESSTGMVYAWGRNYYGSLGTPSTSNTSSPVSIARAGSYIQVASNQASFFLASDGYAWGTGYNANGQIGDNSQTNKSTPVSVVGGPWAKVATGGTHTLFIEKNTGLVYGTGANGSGQLGTNNITNSSTPVALARSSSYIDIAAANSTSAAIDANGSVWTWGANGSGELGNNTTGSNESSPVSIAGPARTYVALNGTDRGFCALDSNGHVWAWGSGLSGVIGDNTTDTRSSPVSVLISRTVTRLSNFGSNSTNVKHRFFIVTVPVNNFNTPPLRDGVSVTSTIDTSVLLSLTNTDPYFNNISKFARVDLTYLDVNSRESKTVTHSGAGFTGTTSWSTTASSGTWRLIRIRCVDTDGAVLFVDRALIGSASDITLA